MSIRTRIVAGLGALLITAGASAALAGTAQAGPQVTLPDGSCWEWQGQRVEALFIPCPEPVIPPLPDLTNVPDDGQPNIPHGSDGPPAPAYTPDEDETTPAPKPWTPPAQDEDDEEETTEPTTPAEPEEPTEPADDAPAESE